MFLGFEDLFPSLLFTHYTQRLCWFWFFFEDISTMVHTQKGSDGVEKLNILGLVGGISKNSLNKKLFKAFQAQAPSNFSIEDFDISQLPFFSQDIETEPPQVVVDFKRKVQEADAVLFVTPEYNHSLPGVLKNAIDWGSRPYGKGVWAKKISAMAGASAGNLGTYGSQQHLRQVLSFLDTRTMHQPEFYTNGSKSFDGDGKLIDERTKEYINKFWKAFGEWIAENKKL
jgi:NAD(P)H-dependent FMN reductase